MKKITLSLATLLTVIAPANAFKLEDQSTRVWGAELVASLSIINLIHLYQHRKETDKKTLMLRTLASVAGLAGAGYLIKKEWAEKQAAEDRAIALEVRKVKNDLTRISNGFFTPAECPRDQGPIAAAGCPGLSNVRVLVANTEEIGLFGSLASQVPQSAKDSLRKALDDGHQPTLTRISITPTSGVVHSNISHISGTYYMLRWEGGNYAFKSDGSSVDWQTFWGALRAYGNGGNIFMPQLYIHARTSKPEVLRQLCA